MNGITKKKEEGCATKERKKEVQLEIDDQLVILNLDFHKA